MTMCPNATKVLAVTEELPDKSAVRSTTVSIGRAQLAARVDISYKSVTGDADADADEMLVGMSHSPSRRVHYDHLVLMALVYVEPL